MTKQNPFNLEGKVALVTGASGAIGRDICLALARAGADVIVSGRNSDRLKKTVWLILQMFKNWQKIVWMISTMWIFS
jgi:NAD(P)-dependent dehydrogenase (short-subunit alcohol dehydrogenase family)